MATTEPAVAPFHLTGNYRPVTCEGVAVDLAVSGELPAALHGSFLRNGPNPVTPSFHWFLGEGMVHGVRLEDGRATWWRNRYVRTASFTEGVALFDEQGRRNLAASKANTSVVRHAGRILALVETSLPYELTPELETVGPWDFGGRLTTPMTAHPKVCPTTGEMHFFGYDFQPPFLTYHVADAAGRLVTSRAVEVPGATMMHDFVLTERFVVFLDLPIVFDLEMAMGGSPLPYRFDAAYGARLGALRRDDPHGGLRWFEVEPCYVFHALNGYDDGEVVTIDVARLASPTIERTGSLDGELWRWTLDLTTGSATERQLDDRPGDFPRIDDRLTGKAAARGWMTSMPDPGDQISGGAITVYDLVDGTSSTHHFGDGRVPGEAVFAPADDRPDGSGWLLAYVYDAGRDTSDVVVLDLDRPADDPVATVHLPARVPYGFHGNWLPG
jgi:carotenoid cleavage dioxygenase-like enzyme